MLATQSRRPRPIEFTLALHVGEEGIRPAERLKREFVRRRPGIEPTHALSLDIGYSCVDARHVLTSAFTITYPASAKLHSVIPSTVLSVVVRVAIQVDLTVALGVACPIIQTVAVGIAVSIAFVAAFRVAVPVAQSCALEAAPTIAV
jgi:hypothetical protein